MSKRSEPIVVKIVVRLSGVRMTYPTVADAKRDASLDVLRGIGLLCIILAHAHPPGGLFQLRNFDVPLMVLVAAASFSISSGKKSGWLSYCWMRFVRIILPVWIFLAVVFIPILWLVFGQKAFAALPPAALTCSFTLMDEMVCTNTGYVWIMRIFFIVAIVVPGLSYLLHRFGKRLFVFAIAVLMFAYEYLAPASVLVSADVLPLAMFELITMSVPYIAVAALGLLLPQMSIKRSLAVSGLFLLAFIAYAGYLFKQEDIFIPTQDYKFPAHFYYLSYALGVSFLLNAIVRLPLLSGFVGARLLAWFGQRTMWIYLWHILLIYVLRLWPVQVNFLMFMGIVGGGATLLAVVQERLIRVMLPKLEAGFARYVRACFLG